MNLDAILPALMSLGLTIRLPRVRAMHLDLE